MKLLTKRFLLTLLLLLLSPVALAHFHYGIDLNTQFVADKNQLKSLHITFLYDPEVSNIYLEDIRSKRDLHEFAVGLVKDLAPLHHFTALKLNGKSVKTATPVNAKAVVVGKVGGENGKSNTRRLKVSFDLPLAQPVTLSGQSVFQLLHVDSTASATLSYKTPDAISFTPLLAKLCHTEIKAVPGFKQGDQPEKVNVICNMPR